MIENLVTSVQIRLYFQGKVGSEECAYCVDAAEEKEVRMATDQSGVDHQTGSDPDRVGAGTGARPYLDNRLLSALLWMKRKMERWG